MTTDPYRKLIIGAIRVFGFAFVGSFLPLVSGILAAPNWNAGKAAVLAALIAGVSAGVKATTDAFTKGRAPVPAVGILPPPP